MKSKVTKLVETTYTIYGKKNMFRYKPAEEGVFAFQRRSWFGWECIDRPLFQRVILNTVKKFESEQAT